MPTLVAVVAVLMLLLALVAAFEVVASRLNVVRALRIAEEDTRGSGALLWVTEHRARSLDTVLVALITLRVAITALGMAIGSEVADGAGALGAVALGAVVLVLVEIATRTFALRHLEATGLAVAGPAKLLVRVFAPLVRTCIYLGRAVVPDRGEVTGPNASDDELRRLDTEQDEPHEELEPEERAMIRSIFELGDTHVREIMVPRPDMVTVASDADLDDVVATVIEEGFSRLPVHDAHEANRIVGVVYAKDLLRRLASRDVTRSLGSLLRAPTFVPETKRVDELLRELQAGTVHLAFVVDEYGELVGLVTIEDILEEIVGEIVDEHDREAPLVEALDDGSLRVDARLGVDDLNDLLGVQLPEEGWDTVGGLVFAVLGHVPAEGERIDLEGVALTVEQVQGRRVGKVLVTRMEPDDDEAGSGEADTPDEADEHVQGRTVRSGGTTGGG